MIGFYIVLVLGCTVEPIVTGKNEINQDTVGVAGAPSVADGVNELARTSPVTAEQAIESTVAAMLAIESTVSAELAIESTVAAAIDAGADIVSRTHQALSPSCRRLTWVAKHREQSPAGWKATPTQKEVCRRGTAKSRKRPDESANSLQN